MAYQLSEVMADFDKVQGMATFLVHHYGISMLVSGIYGRHYGPGVLGITYPTLDKWCKGLNVLGFRRGKIDRLIEVYNYVERYRLRNNYIYPSERLLIDFGRRLDR